MSSARSTSRGRDAPIVTYGRGGAGNKVRSPSRDDTSSRTGVAPDDYSATRGRELPLASTTGTGERIVTYGRGGAANHRSLSRDAVAESRVALQEEAKYVREHQNADVPVSHGRGGAGNISNSRSRSRSRDPAAATPGNPVVLQGRGGYGNVRSSEDTALERLAEDEEAQRVGAERHNREEKEGQLHSTGRGGFSNFFHRTSAEVTREKSRDVPRQSNEYVSTGRGGGGNIYHKE